MSVCSKDPLLKVLIHTTGGQVVPTWSGMRCGCTFMMHEPFMSKSLNSNKYNLTEEQVRK